MTPTSLHVPRDRMERWVENFVARHGETTYGGDGVLAGTAADGSTFRASLPFGRRFEGRTVTELVDAAAPPESWGVVLVRKGGFAVARMRGVTIVESKTGRRHVQGRTKAGGQSQQRFARRRDNQARVAFEAAADHAARVLEGVEVVVTGGDHAALESVLADRRLARLVVVPPWLAVPDPRRPVLEQALVDARAIRVEVVNAP